MKPDPGPERRLTADLVMLPLPLAAVSLTLGQLTVTVFDGVTLLGGGVVLATGG